MPTRSPVYKILKTKSRFGSCTRVFSFQIKKNRHPNTHCISFQILNNCLAQVLRDVMEALQAINGNGDWALISTVVVISTLIKSLFVKSLP